MSKQSSKQLKEKQAKIIEMEKLKTKSQEIPVEAGQDAPQHNTSALNATNKSKRSLKSPQKSLGQQDAEEASYYDEEEEAEEEEAQQK